MRKESTASGCCGERCDRGTAGSLREPGRPARADQGGTAPRVGGVLDRGQFILGDEVAEFEKRFAALCGVRHAVAVNSGTDALVFALRSLGIGPGDEVITAPNSFIASTSCILIAGARPVFVDVCEDYNLDPRNTAKPPSRRGPRPSCRSI